MTWILNNRGLIFGVIVIVVPLVITGWFFGTKKYKEGQKGESPAIDIRGGGLND